MVGEHGHGTLGLAPLGVLHARHRRDRRDPVRHRARQRRGHEGAVGEPGGVDPRGVDAEVALEQVEHRVGVGHVGVARAVQCGVPVHRLAGPVREDHHEALVPGVVAEGRHHGVDLRPLRQPVVVEHERQRGLAIVLLRGGQQEPPSGLGHGALHLVDRPDGAGAAPGRGHGIGRGHLSLEGGRGGARGVVTLDIVGRVGLPGTAGVFGALVSGGGRGGRPVGGTTLGVVAAGREEQAQRSDGDEQDARTW